MRRYVAGAVLRPLLKAMAFVGSRMYRRYLSFGAGLPGERDYAAYVGDGGGNSIVMGCVLWMARTFPEAPPAMFDVDLKTTVQQRIARHAVTRLLTFPNASREKPGGWYSGVILWMATIVSWVLDGNAYWIKVRSAMGRVVQLWYVPHWLIEPHWPDDGSVYIDYYLYRVNGREYKLDPNDVVHFRYGLDPENTRKGYAPLKPVLREVFTDEEAARFSASILKNLGMPGVVLSPAKGASTPRQQPNQTDLDKTKEKFKETFGGDKRGEPLVFGQPMEIFQFGFSPQQLDLSALRDVVEERVTAILGLPAAIVGFGAGLQTTKVGATLDKLIGLAWQQNLIPSQRIMAAEIQTQLVTEFETDLEARVFGFDYSQVKVLREDMTKVAEYWGILVDKKIAKRAEARGSLGLPVDAVEDDVYIESTASSTSGQPGGSSRDETAALRQQVEELQQQLDDATQSTQ